VLRPEKAYVNIGRQ